MNEQPQPSPKKTNWALIAGLIGIVFIVVVVIASVSLSYRPNIVGTSSNGGGNGGASQVTSAQVTVSCGCQPSLLGDYLFKGAIDDGTGSISVQGGSFETTHTWTLMRNGQTIWIFSWTFQANQADGTSGTMTVIVNLSNGQQVFDKSTSVQFGVVSGAYTVQ